MDFGQADEKFKQLKARYAAGELTEAEFKTQLQDLMVQDEGGTWWMIGYETERWYRHDGTDWVQADPPVTPRSIPARPIERAESKPAASAVSKPAPAAQGGRPRWLLPVGIAAGLCLLGVGAIFALPRLLFGPPVNPTEFYYYQTQDAMPTGDAAATEGPTEAPTEPPAPATEAPSAGPQVLFQDDFSDLNSGWPTFSDENANDGYSGDGFYVMRAVNTNVDLIEVPQGQSFDDVRVEVEATNTAGPDSNHFGVVCRYQDIKNFYYFIVSSDGHLLIGKRLGGNWEVLSPNGWAETNPNAIFPGNVTNTIRADCIGSELTLYANGSPLTSVTDTSFAGGNAGLMMGSQEQPNVEISFDNFVVYQP